MAVIVPTYSPSYPLYKQVTDLSALIAATPTSSPARPGYSVQLFALQQQLVDALMDQDGLPASTILSSMTYGQASTTPL